MNKTLESFAREKIIEGLNKLPEEWRHTFNRMYSPNDLGRAPAATVACIPTDKLDWALTQVENSLKKLDP